MARRRNLSNLLESRFECPVSWDGMAGGKDRRFCGQCRCQVFDFAQMEPRAVRARLEASRGKLCARVTRVDGRIQMLAPPSLPAAAPPRKTERAPAIAAGIFGAWLTLAAAQASASPDSRALVSSSAADPQDEGDRATPAAPAAGHEAGLPGEASDEIEIIAASVPVETVTVGVMVAISAPTLRGLFDESDLVFAGRVESSEVLSVEDDIVQVETVLRVARRFKGRVLDRRVTYRHWLPAEAFGPDLAEPLPELTPGSMVVAFLNPAEDDAGRLVFEASSFAGGVRGLAADELAAYSDRLEDLAALTRVAGQEGELDPAGLMDWLVAAAEDPVTRKENTSREILSALEEFEEIAERSEGPEAEPLPELGAMLSEEHKARLAAALLSTRTMGSADLDLFRLVRHVDPATAARWPAEALRSGAFPEGGDALGLLAEFAATLDEATVDAFLEGAEERLGALDEDYPFERSPEAEEAWQQQWQELSRALFAEMAVLLEKATN